MENLRVYSSHPQTLPLQINNSVAPHKLRVLLSLQNNYKNHKLKVQCAQKEANSNNESSKNNSNSKADFSSSSSTCAAYAVLGVHPGCSASELKSAFRDKVKKFHPDVNGDKKESDIMIRDVIQAYEMLSNCSRSEIIERECLDPFEAPESEALDIFVNEVLCIGRSCPYSCVKTAPHAFTYAASTGTARATSQGHGEDYQVQQAVGQCPRSCIHYVTPSQRIILEELLDSILEVPYDTSAEADLLYSLIVKARYENNRFRKPKKQPKTSTQHVDWI